MRHSRMPKEVRSMSEVRGVGGECVRRTRVSLKEECLRSEREPRAGNATRPTRHLSKEARFQGRVRCLTQTYQDQGGTDDLRGCARWTLNAVRRSRACPEEECLRSRESRVRATQSDRQDIFPKKRPNIREKGIIGRPGCAWASPGRRGVISNNRGAGR